MAMPPEQRPALDVARAIDDLRRSLWTLVEYTHKLHQRLCILEDEARDRRAAEIAKQEAQN